jgi:archaeal flagellar protein FlaJ
MMKIPFSILPQKKLYKISKSFRGIAQKLESRFPFLEMHLKQAESKLTSIDYLSMCTTSTAIMFAFFTFVSLPIIKFGGPIFSPPLIAAVISIFMFMQQVAYPKLVSSRRVIMVERGLLAALQDMHVQLNSGVPLFNAMVNVSQGNYGEVSREFEMVVKEINAGSSQVESLENLAMRNPSILFRRSVWQIVNGMKSGADISGLIKDAINTISDEQLTQIQKYGGQLSPLALFYMLIAVIAPSLGTTFVIVISSFISLGEGTVKAVFYGILIFTIFMQIMFMGIIKSRRPSLVSYG